MTTSSQSAAAPNKHSVCLPRSESLYLDQRPQKLKTRTVSLITELYKRKILYYNSVLGSQKSNVNSNRDIINKTVVPCQLINTYQLEKMFEKL